MKTSQFLDQVKQAAFKDELQKISMTIGKITGAIEGRMAKRFNISSPFSQTQSANPLVTSLSHRIPVKPGTPLHKQMQGTVRIAQTGNPEM